MGPVNLVTLRGSKDPPIREVTESIWSSRVWSNSNYKNNSKAPPINEVTEAQLWEKNWCTSGTRYNSCGKITITRIIQGLHLLTRWRRLTTLKKNMIEIYLASCTQVYTWSNSDFKNKSRWLRLTAFKQARKPRSYASPKLCRLTYWHG